MGRTHSRSPTRDLPPERVCLRWSGFRRAWTGRGGPLPDAQNSARFNALNTSHVTTMTTTEMIAPIMRVLIVVRKDAGEVGSGAGVGTGCVGCQFGGGAITAGAEIGAITAGAEIGAIGGEANGGGAVIAGCGGAAAGGCAVIAGGGGAIGAGGAVIAGDGAGGAIGGAGGAAIAGVVGARASMGPGEAVGAPRS